jgi:hypothetical protein
MPLEGVARPARLAPQVDHDGSGQTAALRQHPEAARRSGEGERVITAEDLAIRRIRMGCSRQLASAVLVLAIHDGRSPPKLAREHVRLLGFESVEDELAEFWSNGHARFWLRLAGYEPEWALRRLGVGDFGMKSTTFVVIDDG